jgi:hypothetical protein
VKSTHCGGFNVKSTHCGGFNAKSTHCGGFNAKSTQFAFADAGYNNNNGGRGFAIKSTHGGGCTLHPCLASSIHFRLSLFFAVVGDDLLSLTSTSASATQSTTNHAANAAQNLLSCSVRASPPTLDERGLSVTFLDRRRSGLGPKPRVYRRPSSPPALARSDAQGRALSSLVGKAGFRQIREAGSPRPRSIRAASSFGNRPEAETAQQVCLHLALTYGIDPSSTPDFESSRPGATAAPAAPP